MRRLNLQSVGLILLAGAACGFASAQVIDSPFPGARPLPEDVVEPLFPHISEAEAEIHRKLNEKASVNLEKLPLDEAIQSISTTSGIPIVLDLISIEEAGLKLSVDTPVTLQINNTPLRSVLKALLSPLELDFAVEDDMVKVTTFEVACRVLTTGIYPVADLVTDDVDSWKGLVRLVQGESDGLWEEHDGWGGTIFMSRATRSLVVRQVPEAHADIHRILTFLRAARRIGEQRIQPAFKPGKEGDGLGGDKKAPQKGGGFF